MDLSLTHFHLLLNHFPTIGSVIGLCLFVAALVAKSDHLKQAGLVVFAMIALLTIPAYVTGSAAEDEICVARPGDPCADPNISRSLIQTHESAAMMALLSMVITGGFAWLGLWHYRRMLHLPRWNAAVVCVSSIATLALVSRAANIGGEIRHPEIRTVQEVVGQPLARTVGNYVRDTSWVWVSGETLHFIGLTLMIGVGLLINLRTLGVMRRVPFGALDRMLLWAVLGFGVNIVTGMLFFFAAPSQYINNVAFYWKLVFIVLAGANTLYFFFDKGWASPTEVGVPFLTRFVAVLALFLWVGVMFWGSMLPTIGNAF